MEKTKPSIYSQSFTQRNVVRIMGFAVLFGLIKLSGFSAALLLSNWMSLEYYATFEFALAAGLLLALPLNVGLQGAYPYFNLRLQKEGFVSLFYFHGLWVGSILFIVLGIHHWIVPFLSLANSSSLLIGAIIALQILFSAILKSHEKIIKAVVLDGGMFLVLNVYLLYLFATEGRFEFGAMNGLLMIYLGVLLLLYGQQYLKYRIDFSTLHYRKALNYGRHLVLSSVLIIALTNGARLFIAWFIELEQVAYYAFYLRFALILLMIQQVFLISFFKKIYQSPPYLLDQFFALLSLSLTLMGLFIWWAVPYFLEGQFSLLAASIADYRDLFYILCFHIICWANLAFNEQIIHREKLSIMMNHRLILLLMAMTLMLFIWSTWSILQIQELAIVNLLILFAAVEIQFSLLAKQRNFRLRRSRAILRFSLLFFSLSYLWIV
ncbi:MAG: hypothetical protein AAF985_06655 [Bacteroidota bacterium]